jgi:hypothetical protein
MQQAEEEPFAAAPVSAGGGGGIGSLATRIIFSLVMVTDKENAEGGTRTPMPRGATPSRWCVCQFHHFGEIVYFFSC